MAMMETARVRALDQLVQYQDDSVVSKTVIGKKTGTITLFAFDAGQALSEHTAPFDALVQILDGKTEISIAGERFDLESGDMIILPANIPHALQAVTPFKMMLVMIKS